VLLNVPLSEFVKNEPGDGSSLASTKVTFLLYAVSRLKVICVVPHWDAAPTGHKQCEESQR